MTIMENENQNKPSPYSPLATVVITVAIYFAGQLFAGILISIIPLARHWSTAQTTSWLQENVWAMFAFVLMVEALTLALLYLFLRQRKMTFGSIGFNKAQAKYVAYALAGFSAYFVLYIVGLIIAKALVPNLDLE